MRDILFPFQQEIFDKEKNNKSNALFMDMGSGKTITSMALMNEKPVDKVLVVCLVSKVNDWVEEYKQWNDRDLIPLRSGTKKNKELLKEESDGFVINFESVWRLGDDLLDMIDETWGVIVDESHMIKNRKSKVTKYMYQVGNRTPYKIILTGTPQSQGYIDYYSQMKFLGKWKMTVAQFERNYCKMGKLYLGKHSINVIQSYKNTDELEKMVNDNSVFYRIKKEDNMIPRDNYVSIDIHSSYNRFKDDEVLQHGDKYILGDTKGAYRMGLKQLASGFLRDYRAPQLYKRQWVDDLLKVYDERVVIFYNFNGERDMLIELLEKIKRPYSEYSGRTRDLTVFKENDNAVALINYGSGSTGINDLVLSNVGVFFSPVDDVITFQQARGRLDRIGQERQPLFYYLQAKDSIEIPIYRALKAGKDFDDKLFDLYLTENV